MLSCSSSSRIIDFESIAILKEFKPKIVLPKHDFGLAESWKRPIPFWSLMDFATAVIQDPTLTKYTSMLISEDEEAEER